MQVRFAQESDLERVNELRRQVNEVHVKGRPDIFRPGFNEELRNYVYTIFADPEKEIAVAEKDGVICGFAVFKLFTKPESPYMNERRYLYIDEFGTDEAHRRQGAGRALADFITEYAKSHGVNKMELDMWEFNEGAMRFYEEMGFRTYRRYLEMDI